MGTVDNLLFSTAKNLNTVDHSPNTQQLSPFLPKTISVLGRKVSCELPWRTALIPLLRKYIANKSLSTRPVHTPLSLCWLYLTPLRQAAWTERDSLLCGLPQSWHHLHTEETLGETLCTNCFEKDGLNSMQRYLRGE